MKLTSLRVIAILPTMVALSLPIAANAADLEPLVSADAPIANPTSSDFYVSLFGGASFKIGDTNFTNGITALDTEFDTGYLVGGAVGYRWRNFEFNGFTPRTEIEVNYFDTNLDSINFSGNGPAQEVLAGGSDISGVGLFGNLYVDYTNAFDTGLSPYVFGGVGAVFANLDIAYNAGNLNLQDNDTAFAWQVGVGASYEVAKNVSLFTDVRYQQIVNLSSVRRAGPVPVVGAGGGSFEDDLNNVIARAGLSISF